MRKFSDTEEEILKILWSIGKGFPKEILAHFKKPLAYNTFLSTVRKLEKEGFLGYKKFGRSHQYYPLIAKSEYSHSLFRNLFKNFLGGSREQLLSFFMEEENIDPSELEALLKNFKSKSND
jgi:predicted transcriptional regulator